MMKEAPPVERGLTDSYGELAVWQTERILGLGDREPESGTYGCFDRQYWCYKLIDFSNARAQEVSQFLALLYLLEEDYNPFAKNESIREWAIAAIEYWMEMQARDGSFNAFRPYEQSFPASSFSTLATIETVTLLDLDTPTDALHKACRWLAKNKYPISSHATAASVLALDMAGRLLDERRFVDTARDRLVDLLQNQTPEGAFPEHWGFDLGFQSVTLYLLTLYTRRTRDEQAYDSIQQAVRLVDKRLHEDGTFNSAIMSRRTQFFHPLAFVLLREEKVVQRHLSAVGARRALNPAWLDDRNCIHLATNYLQTAYEVYRLCS